MACSPRIMHLGYPMFSSKKRMVLACNCGPLDAVHYRHNTTNPAICLQVCLQVCLPICQGVLVRGRATRQELNCLSCDNMCRKYVVRLSGKIF